VSRGPTIPPMPILSFQSRWVEPILTGRKTQTLRRTLGGLDRAETVPAYCDHGRPPFAHLPIRSIEPVHRSDLTDLDAAREGMSDLGRVGSVLDRLDPRPEASRPPTSALGPQSPAEPRPLARHRSTPAEPADGRSGPHARSAQALDPGRSRPSGPSSTARRTDDRQPNEDPFLRLFSRRAGRPADVIHTCGAAPPPLRPGQAVPSRTCLASSAVKVGSSVASMCLHSG
jgi:hypothetical protein